MEFHERIRNAITQNKQKVQLFQWATISSVSSLIYSEYIRRIEKKTFPTMRIDVPPIHSVKELLRTDGNFMDRMSHYFIENMARHPLMEEYSKAPELILFTKDNREVLKCIFDAYIIPNIAPTVCNAISSKFGLRDEKQQTVFQNREIDLFDGMPLDDPHMDYVVQECVLQMMLLLPTLARDVQNPKDQAEIIMKPGDIITINNRNAVAPIHLDPQMIHAGGPILDLISFVSSTTFNEDPNPTGEVNFMEEMWRCNVSSSPYNDVTITRITGESVASPDTEG